MVTERITETSDLKIGDVVTVATKTRKGYWWRRFAVVTHLDDTKSGYLRLAPEIQVAYLEVDMSTADPRDVDLELQVVYLIPNEGWPEGVSAMYAKALAKGWIKLG